MKASRRSCRLKSQHDPSKPDGRDGGGSWLSFLLARSGVADNTFLSPFRRLFVLPVLLAAPAVRSCDSPSATYEAQPDGGARAREVDGRHCVTAPVTGRWRDRGGASGYWTYRIL
ncbi:hypothetical protein AAHC03_013577 [Spirometra sp. Aus1]